MKRKKILSSVAAITLFGLSLAGPSVMAANPYGIEYDGGEPLSADNMTIIPTFNQEGNKFMVGANRGESVDDLQIVFDDEEAYERGYYISSGKCISLEYIPVGKDGISKDDAKKYSFSFVDGGSYTQRVEISEIKIGDEIQGSTVHQWGEDGKAIIPIARVGYVFFQANQKMYKDSTCETPIDNLVIGDSSNAANNDASNTSNTRFFPNYIFVNIHTQLIDNSTKKPVESDKLYLYITDIDASQSYKILNEGNEFAKERIIKVDAADIQPATGSLKNMFVADGSYIYSQPTFTISKQANNLTVTLDKKTQRDGVDIVLGFANGAGSGVEFVGKQFDVTYKSDDKGTISGKTSEKVLYEMTPSGSEATPNANYEFEYWTADKDVELKDGTKIKKGERLTARQVMQVIVTEDLEFTAHHTTIKYTVTYESDEHGKITGIESEKLEYGKNPAGSKETPANDYETKYWVADVDVVLKDGSKIKKGAKLTEAQIKQVFVDQNITFTVIHEKVEAKAPNGGMFTGEADSNTIGLITPIATIAAITLGGIAIREIKARKAVRKF